MVMLQRCQCNSLHPLHAPYHHTHSPEYFIIGQEFMETDWSPVSPRFLDSIICFEPHHYNCSSNQTAVLLATLHLYIRHIST